MDKLVRNNRLTKEELLIDEAIYSQANGFLGTRGNFVEGYGKDYDYNQTYLNAFYDKYDYFYEENFSGFPQSGQKFVNLIDGQRMNFMVDGSALNLNNCEVISLNREYDFETGVTTRTVHYKTAHDKEFILTERKIVSVYKKEVIAINVKVESVNFKGIIKVQSYLGESKKMLYELGDPRINSTDLKQFEILQTSVADNSIIAKTLRSNLFLKTVMLHKEKFNVTSGNELLIGEQEYSVSPGSKIDITKYIVYTSNLYHEDYIKDSLKIVKELENITFEKLIEEQKKHLKKFWNKSYIKINNNKYMEALLNYNLYQLNSSGGDSTIHNISAKGLSGEGYEGHYFWDTEIYMVPFFILTNPIKAKNLLMYRYNTMSGARKEAKNLGYNVGIKFPWRTINGDEASPYYPAGSAQFHINSDIAYAIIKYFEATNDLDFITKYGFEMMVESARFLREAVNYNGEHYHLNSVTGPDEYTTVVDDNYYTNQLLKYHFSYIYKLYNKYKLEFSTIIKKLEITSSEIDLFKEIAEKIHLPFDKKLNIFTQDAAFLQKKKLDLKSIPADKYPLLMNFHPLFLYKHQVLKQADTMLSMMLLDYDDMSILEDSFNYYEPITTHDSSLSKCIYSILAFKLKKYDLACSFFEKVLETDLLNTQKNTSHGLHVANMGGSYLGFVYGVVGLRIKGNYLQINPITTKEINNYELNIMYQGVLVNIKVDDQVIISSNGKANLKVYGKEIELNGIYQVALST
jgi:alpha,alpha-trehalose phosphorylase